MHTYIASADRLSMYAHVGKATSHRLVISATTIGVVPIPITLLRDETRTEVTPGVITGGRLGSKISRGNPKVK